VAALLGIGLAAALVGPAVPAHAESTERYIVTTTSTGASEAKVKKLRSAKAPIGRQFRHVLHGFSASLTTTQVAQLTADPTVESVRKVTTVKASDVDPSSITRQTGATWGLDRIDRRSGLDGSYFYTSTGAGMTAYVIDTGIRMDHADFGGRATSGYDVVDNDSNASDCPGNYKDDPENGLISHGTHVAATIGGKTYGVAKRASIVSVRALDCYGDGTSEGVVAALDWVLGNHVSTPSVVNMSLGGGANPDIDAAVSAVIAAGIPLVAAAGNYAENACDFSPARVPAALTIGASARNDQQAWDFTNYGPCLDLFAPGAAITSAGTRTTTASLTLDGTSMAAPHVTGAVLRYLQTHPTATPAEVSSAIVGSATTVAGLRDNDGSPAKLLYVYSETSPTAPTSVAGSRSDKAKTASIRWGAPSGTGGFPLTGYRVIRTGKDAAGRSSVTVDLSTAARSHTFGGLKAGTTYTLSVQARNALGLGPAASTRLTITALPGQPKITSATKGSSKDKKVSIGVAWNKPSSGGPVTTYVVTATRNSTGSVKTVTVSGSARKATVSGLKKNKTYTIRVRAGNDSGSGPTARWGKSVKAR
jgi:subtilisin family serine protease